MNLIALILLAISAVIVWLNGDDRQDRLAWTLLCAGLIFQFGHWGPHT